MLRLICKRHIWTCFAFQTLLLLRSHSYDWFILLSLIPVALIVGMLKWHCIIHLLCFYIHLYKLWWLHIKALSDVSSVPSGLCPAAPTVFPGKRGHLQRKILEVRNHACHRFENLISLKYLLPSFLWFYLFLREHLCRTHAGDTLQESIPGKDEGVCVDTQFTHVDSFTIPGHLIPFLHGWTVCCEMMGPF